MKIIRDFRNYSSQIKILIFIVINLAVFQSGKSQNKLCPPEGNASNQKTARLNVLKNRTVLPSANNILHLDLSDILVTKTKLQDETAVMTEGWISAVKRAGPTSSNCNSRDLDELDIHVYLARTEKEHDLSKCLLLVITPRMRRLKEWSPTLIDGLVGKRMKFTGWMLYNYEQAPNSRTTLTQGHRALRQTPWEIHPVTDFVVLP
jgi:hypothetical protein